MDRLTIFTGECYESINPVDLALDEYSDINFEKIVDKLARYEDLEEKCRILKGSCEVGDTESEAIKELQENIDLPFGSNVSKEAAKIAIQALEKQIPKKPIKSKEQKIRYVNTYCCPICKLKFTGTGIAKWCYHCGQKLDWSDTE